MLLDCQNSAFLLIDMQEKLLPAVAEHEQITAHCQWLLQAAQLFNVPAICSEQYAKGLGCTVEPLRSALGEAPVFDKTVYSCASHEPISQAIAGLKRKQLILCGIEAHVCVLQTALELAAADYQVYVAATAVGSRNQADKELAMGRMQSAGITLISHEMAGFEWCRSSTHPQFKTFSRELLR